MIGPCLLSIQVQQTHVQRVNGGEHLTIALGDAFTCFGHGDERTVSDKHRNRGGGQRQVVVKVPADQNQFLVSETHLATCVFVDIDATQELPALARMSGALGQRSLNLVVVFVVDDVVDRVSLGQQVLLRRKAKGDKNVCWGRDKAEGQSGGLLTKEWPRYSDALSDM